MLTALIAGPLAAQGPSPVGLRAIAPGSINTPGSPRLQHTQWKTGMIIGGAVGVIVDVLIATDYPCDSGCTMPIGSMLGVLFVLTLIGGLIGNAFRKH
jgi:hypothetical protein